MKLRELLKNLTEALPITPYERLELTWNEHMARWEAGFAYWSVRPGLRKHPWGRTPQEAVRKFVSQLKGRELCRSGQNGNWGAYKVKVAISCDDVAFTKPVPLPPLGNGHREVLPTEAVSLIKAAEEVFLKTHIGDRLVKGPETHMVEEDKGGKGVARVLKGLRSLSGDCPIEIGYYRDGKEIGLRGGLW